MYYYYPSPKTSQSATYTFTSREREINFPDVNLRDLSRNIAILSKPEDVTVVYPLRMVQVFERG